MSCSSGTTSDAPAAIASASIDASGVSETAMIGAQTPDAIAARRIAVVAPRTPKRKRMASHERVVHAAGSTDSLQSTVVLASRT